MLGRVVQSSSSGPLSWRRQQASLELTTGLDIGNMYQEGRSHEISEVHDEMLRIDLYRYGVS